MSDPTFLTISDFRIPIVVDETLSGNEWKIVPQLTQDDINRWIKDNPEKAKKFLADAKRLAMANLRELTSASFTIKSDIES